MFDTGKATFKAGAGSEETLQQLIDYLKKNTRVTKLRIEGHTDDVGEDAANMTLSGQRALTIKNFLISKEIKAERLLAVGFGETNPIADNKTDEGRAKNRRTEFKIAGLDGKKYMGQPENGGGQEFK